MHYQWKLPEPQDPEAVSGLQTGVGTSAIISRLLVSRGVTDPVAAKEYLNPDLSSARHDPFLMKGMEKACYRLKRARETGELVMVHGDYDVDGITSLAMLMRFLGSAGISATPYIPERQNEGYGLSLQAVEEAAGRGAGLILTADCGINAVKEVDCARSRGIDVIITDHHQPCGELPEAFSILNPKQDDCTYPEKDLAGVGVAWKLCLGLFQCIDGDGEEPNEYIDLAGLGSIADVVPVRGENRAIIHEGLRSISGGKRVGIRALKRAAALRPEELTYRDVAFVLAPRLNAAGRLGRAEKAYRLLYTDDDGEAEEYAAWLEEENSRRRKIDSKVAEEARDVLARSFDSREDYAIVLASRKWHPGVIGIVASRIAEEYYRPAVLISVVDGVGKGSARSIPGFSIYDAISRCSSFLQGFGGHTYAAGLTIEESNIDRFREALQRVAKEELSLTALEPSLALDLEIGIESVSDALTDDLKAMEPFGPGNPDPVFCIRDLRVSGSPRVLRSNTLKFPVRSNGVTIDVLGFGKGDYLEKLRKGSRVDIAVRIGEDKWRGERRIGMKLEDIRLRSVES